MERNLWARGLGPWDPRSQPLAPDPSRDKLPPHPVLSRLPLEEMGTRGQPLLSPPRERSHVGGGSALGTGQSAQASQARADVLHRRAITGTPREPRSVWAGPRSGRGCAGFVTPPLVLGPA